MDSLLSNPPVVTQPEEDVVFPVYDDIEEA
ncbi:hypothetical protein KIPB_016378, partial [Kipferlia bialata]|eukprot:g16378.t1